MSPEYDAADARRGEDVGEPCYRCDDRVPADRVIHVATDPCPELAGRYEPVSRPCCPDCVAGLGLLTLVTDVPLATPVGSD